VSNFALLESLKKSTKSDFHDDQLEETKSILDLMASPYCIKTSAIVEFCDTVSCKIRTDSSESGCIVDSEQLCAIRIFEEIDEGRFS
jgi:hypothetical protein